MKQGNLWKGILFFSLPLMFTNLLQLLFNMADVAIAGKFAGALSLGAVGSTTLLVSLTTGWLIGLSSGVNAVVAFFSGASDAESEQHSVQTGFLICLAAGLVTFAAGFLLAKPVLRLLGTKEVLIDEAALYFRIYMAGSPALAAYNFGNGVLSAEGRTKEPLICLSAAGVVNVLLNLFFVIAMKMSAGGVALASVIAQYLSALLVLRLLLTANGPYRLDLHRLHPDKTHALRILGIGIPAALQYSLFSVANLFVQSAVNSFDHLVVAGNAAAMNFDNIVYDMMAAFYIATTSYTAQNYGAGSRERVRKTYAVTTVYSFGLALFLGACIFIFREPLLYLFTDDAAVVRAGSVRLEMLTFAYCLSAFMDNAIAACRGLGKTLVPTFLVSFGTVVFRIVWVVTVFAHFRTLQSLYLLYGCAFVITGFFLNIYFLRIYKQTFPDQKTDTL